MKKLALAVALTAAASTAYAGNISEPVMEPVVVVEEAASSSAAGIWVPLLLVALVAAATQ